MGGLSKCCCMQVMAPPPKPATPAAGAATKAKQRERARMDANVEKEVDRIIDSQDNEYVLSRPKCGSDPTPIIRRPPAHRNSDKASCICTMS